MFWTGLSPDEAREYLANKDKSKRDKKMTLTEAVNKFVKDGANIGIGGFVNSRQPIAIIHEIIRQERKDLTISFQSAGLAPEYLAGAMAINPDRVSIKRVELAYWAHEYAGISSMFRYLAENSMIQIEDWTNYNMSARFKAGSMGLPFIPCRSPLGADVNRSNRSVTIDCPFTGRPITLLPASHPDVGIIHVQEADQYGNCRIKGQSFTCPEISMAAAHTIITCEKLVEDDIITSNSTQTAIPYFAVDAVVEVPFGAYPGMCHDYYYFSQSHIANFKGLTEKFRKGDRQGLEEYYEKYVYGVQDFDGFIAQIPYKELKYIQQCESRSLELQTFLEPC
ncbi:MAG: CoA transferase subunit A [Bacillota bacterium]|nr:CoA transferase subunit A [Clostridia bacterium]